MLPWGIRTAKLLFFVCFALVGPAIVLRLPDHLAIWPMFALFSHTYRQIVHQSPEAILFAMYLVIHVLLYFLLTILFSGWVVVLVPVKAMRLVVILAVSFMILLVSYCRLYSDFGMRIGTVNITYFLTDHSLQR